MKNNWEKDIHDRLGNFEQDAPDGLWADISKKMAVGNSNKSAWIYKLYRMASVAAAACVILILGYNFYVNNDKAEKPQMPQSSSNFANNDSRKHSLIQDANTAVVAETIRTSYCSDEIEVCQENTPDSPNCSLAPADTVKTTESVGTTENDATRNESTYHKNTIEHNRHNNNSLLAQNAETGRSLEGNSHARWSISTNAMGTVGLEKSSKYIGEPIVAAGPDDAEWQDNPMLGIAIFNQGKEVKTEYKHHLPVRIGVKIGYAFNEKFCIESGLSYTRLSSDIKSGSDDNYFTGEQKLNYVGVPVGVKYNALIFKYFCLYGTANTLLEKCVLGNVTNNYVINKATNKTETHTIDSKPLQFSVGASVGVQVDILDNIGIYAEPGLSYHFNDHSSLQTIYKEKPLNFNLSVGIRYTINK